MNILITGVAGMIGSNLSEYLNQRGYSVWGIDDLSGGYLEFVPEGVNFKELSLLDHEGLSKFMEICKPDVVYHLAAYAAEGLSPFIRRFNYNNNVISSVNIINECIKNEVQKIIFTSSMAVYGHGQPPFVESSSPSPADPYGVAKYAIEQDLKCANDQFGLKYTILRPHNVIGLNQNIWDRYRNVIGIWIRQSLKGEPLTIFGDGRQTRAFSDVQYILRPFEQCIESCDSDTINIGADHAYEIIEVAKILQNSAKKYGINVEIEHLEPRNEVKHAHCDHSRAKSLLGFEDKTDIENVITRMFEWARLQPDREMKRMSYEIDRDIYSYWR